MSDDENPTVEVEPPTDRPLRDEIAELLLGQMPGTPGPGEVSLAKQQANVVMDLLNLRGHFLPGAPPAREILEDARSFAERLVLSNLAARVLNMLAEATVENQETKATKRWISDYLEGRGHGPIGKPMLWPRALPALSMMLRQWGFEPTPGHRQYVRRAVENPTIQ